MELRQCSVDLEFDPLKSGILGPISNDWKSWGPNSNSLDVYKK